MTQSIFKKLTLNFILSCVLVGGILLLVVFSAVFAIAYQNTQSNINEQVDEGINSMTRPNGEFKNDYITFVVSPSTNHADYYGTDIYGEEFVYSLLDKAMEVKEGDFVLEDYHFRVAYVDTRNIKGDNLTLYSLYDYTTENENLTVLGITLGSSFVLCLGLLCLIGWAFSKRAVKPVEDAFTKQRELIANASHELKTPLSIVSTNIALIEDDKSKTVGENQKWFDNIDSYISRMDKLILDMLELSKLDAESSISRQATDISSIVQGCVLSLEAVCYEKQLTVTTNIQPDIVIDSVASLFERLTLILLDNAIKYADEKGAITVSLSRTDKSTVLEVGNNGKGISKENLDRIFDRFYRSDSARTSDKNNSFGLGLSIAKAICDNLSAKISVSSQIDGITKFTVSF